MEHALLYLILACIFGFFMAWGIGANDTANAMGTSVGSRALTIKQAIIIAAIFEVAGALLAGGEVTDTIRSRIIDFGAINQSPEILIFGMMAALLAAGTWLFIASVYGWPVSTTHSIIGAIMGFGITIVGVHAIDWDVVINILLSWVLTPTIAGVIAYLVFRSIQKLIFNSPTPFKNAKKYIPIYIFFVVFVICLVTFVKGLQHVGLDLSFRLNLAFSIGISAFCTLLGVIGVHRMKVPVHTDPRHDYKYVEKVFSLLMIFTAASMAFAHGSNDVANAIGPIAAIVNILHENGLSVVNASGVPFWILILGALGIFSGLAMYGYKVIMTVGEKITELTPSRGFAAEVAAATTIVLATGTGLPISTTQTLVGAILGVGFARGISALRLNVIRNIFMSWIITLPAGAFLAIFFFYILKIIFSI